MMDWLKQLFVKPKKETLSMDDVYVHRVVQYCYLLKIRMNDGELYTWNFKYNTPQKGHYNDFLKWYHSRSDSESYSLYSEDGLWRLTILRKNISTFEIGYKETFK